MRIYPDLDFVIDDLKTMKPTALSSIEYINGSIRSNNESFAMAM